MANNQVLDPGYRRSVVCSAPATITSGKPVRFGALTGVVGVGGGFLIVPALVLLSGIPMKTAIGTSLAIVAANASTGFVGYMGMVPVDWTTMISFTSVTVAGSFFGTRGYGMYSRNSGRLSVRT